MRHVLSIVSVLAFATPAMAQTVDDRGAAQLTQDLKRYVGETAFAKGILKVSVEGDAYKIALDLKALGSLLPTEAGAKIDFSPYELKVKPRGDGTWDVAGNVLPNGSAEFNGPQGRQHIAWTVTDGKMTGIYDPVLATFSTAEGTIGGMTMKSGDAKQTTDASFGAGVFTMTGKPGASGGVDVASTQTFANFSETVTINDPELGMNLPITLKAPKFDVTSNGTGFRSKEMLDLLAFGVANADETKIKTNQAELKTRLLAVLPLWDKIEGVYGVNSLEVSTPMGNFGAGDLAVSFAGDGISKNGSLHYGMKLAGMSMPMGVLPAWSAKVLPTDLDLNFGGANLDLDTLVRKAVDAFDLTKEPPIADAVGAQLGAEFLAKGPKFVIEKSVIKNGETQFTFVGDVVMRGDKPELNATIDAAGYDKMVEHIQAAAASDPQAQQAFPALLAVKGFAKTQSDGTLQWVVNAKPDGSVFINGGMIKGPTPALPEPNAPPADPNAPPGTLTNPQ